MGGFACTTRGIGDVYFPEDTPREFVFTFAGVAALARDRPHILDISKETIADKSKASGLAKGIACAQAIWFCVQCLDRLTQARSISLLEVWHTRKVNLA